MPAREESRIACDGTTRALFGLAMPVLLVPTLVAHQSLHTTSEINPKGLSLKAKRSPGPLWVP